MIRGDRSSESPCQIPFNDPSLYPRDTVPYSRTFAADVRAQFRPI